MSQQLLFDIGGQAAPPVPPPTNASVTRRAASVAIRPHVAGQRAKILRVLHELGDAGATDAELQSLLNMRGDSERPRRIELVRDGLVLDSGRVRLSPAGRVAIVWIARGER